MSHGTLHRLGTATVVALVALSLATGGAVAHGGDDGFHHHDGFMGTHDGGWWGWGLGWLWMGLGLLALVLIPVATLFLVRDRTADPDGDGAMARLRERYAAGEIDEEEFERRRSVLQD